MSSCGSAVLFPPATVLPNCPTAVGMEATVRHVSVAGLYSSTVFTGATPGALVVYPPNAYTRSPPDVFTAAAPSEKRGVKPVLLRGVTVLVRGLNSTTASGGPMT